QGIEQGRRIHVDEDCALVFKLISEVEKLIRAPECHIIEVVVDDTFQGLRVIAEDHEVVKDREVWFVEPIEELAKENSKHAFHAQVVDVVAAVIHCLEFNRRSSA